MDKVTCSTCGFLGKYVPGIHVPPPRFVEMDEHGRASGKVFSHSMDALAGAKECFPVCFRNAPEIIDELHPFQDPRQRDPQRLLAVIHQERSCKYWGSYIPGFNPKEHFVYMKFAELEEDRRNFEQKMDNSNRSFQMFLTAVVAIFAIAELWVGLFQVAYPAGLPNAGGFLDVLIQFSLSFLPLYFLAFLVGLGFLLWRRRNSN